MITQHDNYRIARSLNPNAAIIRPLSNGTYLAFDSVEEARHHPTTQTIATAYTRATAP